MSAAEDEFAMHLTGAGIEYQREYKFHPDRRWRADFFVEPDLLIEIEGGVFVRGRHSRGAGMVKDMEKYNAAALLGYRVLRFEPSKHVETGEALAVVEMALELG